MNDMYAKSEALKAEIHTIGRNLSVYDDSLSWAEYARAVTKKAESLAARAEVLEREYATVSRIISAIESRAKAEEVQVLQGAIQPDPTNAGSVQPVMCDPVSQG